VEADEIRDVRLEQSDREEWSAFAGSKWARAEDLYAHLRDSTNLIAATDVISWDELIPEQGVVLDLGCGSGWLAGKLTRLRRVERVIAWDSSLPLLTRVLPSMVALVDGDVSKIERVCGGFTPLLIADNSIDLVVMSSAFHHATDPDALFDELKRVVREPGAIALLNEVPYAVTWLVLAVGITGLAAIVNGVSSRVTLNRRGHVAADHVLYDDVLGDSALTRAQWSRLFRKHALDAIRIDTSLPPYPAHYRRRFPLEQHLTHFILRSTS
jgi:SAM-dependent methyltransferase